MHEKCLFQSDHGPTNILPDVVSFRRT